MDDNLLNKPIDQMTDGDMKVPEKFLDPQTGELRTDALLKSYMALEKKLSQMGPSLADPDGRRRALKELGCPDCADDYDVDLSHGMFQGHEDIFEPSEFEMSSVDPVKDLV